MRTFYLKLYMMLMVFCATLSSAQAITENFDNINTLSADGWLTKNHSSPIGAQANWFQGNPATDGGPFDAYNGVSNSYIAANYNFVSGANDINGWLLTPNRTFRNGDVISFYSRKATGQDYPDRLEVRLSKNGASTDVGTTSTSVGDFTTLLMSINPNLTTGVYPTTWTKYTVSISGLSAPTSGRLAFRYFVTNGGPTGTNSDYIGIDAFTYTPYACPAFSFSPANTELPSGAPDVSYSQTIGVTGAQGATNFSITSGALPDGLTIDNTGTITGTPTTVGNYNFTVTATDTSGCTGSHNYSINVIGSMSLSGSQTNVSCNGGNNGTATVTASGGTTPYTYAWNTSPIQNAATATNLSVGNYTVTVTDASSISKTLSFQITEPAPINVVVTGNSTCANTSANLTATGAQQYFWFDQIGDTMSSHVGNVYTTPALTNNTTYYVQGVNLGAQNALKTTFDAGNNHRGNMINVTAQNDLMISSFDVSPMENTTIEVYYKEGTYAGFANDPSAWKLLGNVAVAYNNGNPVNAVVGNLYIPAGKTYALYITSANTSVALNYTTLTSVQTYTDQNMSIEAGIGLEYPFTNNTGTVYNPRIWNGRINYDLVTCQATRQAVAVTVNTTAAPTGNAIQSFNQNDTLTALIANGSTIKWYASQSDAASHINSLPISTTIINNTKYYATQTVNNCESTESLEVLAYNPTLASNEVTNQSTKIYPNPVKELLNINSTQNISQIKIFSMDGRLLMEKKNMTSKSIDVSTLPIANYIIKVYTDGGEEVQYRFIKK